MRRKSSGAALDLGYTKGFAEAYELGKELGRGGNGVVRHATQRATGAWAGAGQNGWRLARGLPARPLSCALCLPPRPVRAAARHPTRRPPVHGPVFPKRAYRPLASLALTLPRAAQHAGRQFAVKSIPKVLNDPAASERKKADQIPYLKREVGARASRWRLAGLLVAWPDAGGALLAAAGAAGQRPARPCSQRHNTAPTEESSARAPTNRHH